MVNDTIARFKNDKLITENIAKGLQVQQPDTPKFYTRPKIHKTGNPGCPVVGSVNLCQVCRFSSPANCQKHSFICKRHYRFPSKIR